MDSEYRGEIPVVDAHELVRQGYIPTRRLAALRTCKTDGCSNRFEGSDVEYCEECRLAQWYVLDEHLTPEEARQKAQEYWAKKRANA